MYNEYDDNNVFKLIINKKIKAEIVFENDYSAKCDRRMKPLKENADSSINTSRLVEK